MRGVGEQGVERGPPVVDGLVGARALAQVPVAAAALAEPEASGRVQRRERERGQSVVAHERLEVDQAIQRRTVIVGPGLALGGDEQLLHVELETTSTPPDSGRR